MLVFILCVAVANAAVIPNGTTSSTVSAPTPPPQAKVAALATGPWTFDFSEFITVAPTYNPNDATKVEPTLTTISHLYPQMYPIFALRRVPEIPWIGLASPYANSYAMAHGHTHSDESLRSECYNSFYTSQDNWIMTAPIDISTEYPTSTILGTSEAYSTVTRGSWSHVTTTATVSGSERFIYSAVPSTLLSLYFQLLPILIFF